MRKKIDSYLGFAKKSRNLISGGNTCVIMGQKKKLKLIIVCEDASENSKEKMMTLARKNKIPCLTYGKSDDISRITGTTGRSVFGIVDSKFAEIIVHTIDQEKIKDKEGIK